MKECIVILGMHRSGTSVLSGLVSSQGFYLGESEMPKREDNPKGFFENMRVYRLNQKILESYGTSWDNSFFTFRQIPPADLYVYQEQAREIIKSEFGLVKRIFIKDPRMCLLFPLWEVVLKEMGFRIKVILAYRSPMEVAHSLKARNELAVEKSLMMWSHYFFQAEKTSREYERLVVRYSHDFADLDAFYELLGIFLDVELNNDMYLAAHDLYTPKLKHHQLQLDSLSSEVPQYLSDFISLLKEEKLDNYQQLDNIINEFYHSQAFYLYNEASQTKELAKLREDLDQNNKKLLFAEKEHNSLSETLVKKARLKEKELKDELSKDKSECVEKIKKLTLASEKKLQDLSLKSEKKLQDLSLKSEKKLQDLSLESEKRLHDLSLDSKKQLEVQLRKEEEAKQQLELEYAAALEQQKTEGDELLNSKTIELEGQVQKADAQFKKAKVESNQRLKEVRQCKASLESLRRQKDVLNQEGSTLRNKIKKLEGQLALGDDLFNKSHSSKKWNKKFGHLSNGANYFKTRKFVIPFAKQRSKKLWQEKALIIESGLFSSFYYLTQNPDIWQEKVDPLNHFCNRGWREGRNPSSVFNTQDYMSMYSDVVKTGMNPLLHYIKFGIKEGRRPKLNVTPKKLGGGSQSSKGRSSSSRQLFQQKYSGAPRGGIDSFANGEVSGWFLSKDSVPVVKINGVPSLNTLGVDPEKQDIDFTTSVASTVYGEAQVELLALNEDGLVPVHNAVFQKNYYAKDKYADLELAYEICQDPDAVAITVWEGAHNPIGRAKVLYDVVNTSRPVVIFAYVFGSFGNDLWGPLVSSGINVVLIPYEERLAYQSYIQNRGIQFNTIWICKHRLHSFELASLIAKPDTACILDMDDNEDVFVSSKASESKPYGIFSKNKSNYFLGKVPVRSVASVSLLENYGGMLMRHAREIYQTDAEKVESVPTAVFVGTIRPHKNITELVNAVAKFNDTATEKIKLAIGGDFNPPSLRETLNTAHTIILDEVNNDELFDTLAKYDVLITGYPDEESDSAEINRYQITSKIGDGLAIGKPVLTPYSPAVEDLQDVPGLFVFREGNFNMKLQEALEYKEAISLPKEFTLEHSYETFLKLEKDARNTSKASNVFELEPFFNVRNLESKAKRNVVLIWKQHDAGVYGRRIDQIARYYKQENPECNVTIVEAMSEKQIAHAMSSTQQFDNSTVIINEALSHKLYKYSIEGVEYRLISYDGDSGWSSFEEKFNSYLSAEEIYPYNSLMVLFPLHAVFNDIISVLKNYKVVVDLVDNQIKWITSPEGRVKGLKQYYDLVSIADEVVANSPQNIDYFEKRGFFEGNATPKIIPNWYTLPKSLAFQREVSQGEINLVYSGNLNDRIDWELLKQICERLAEKNGFLHIAGSTIRRAEEMKELLAYENCVYHGVVNEQQLLRLLQHMNFAVIPHIEDKISKFMDPIKLKMYKKLGLHSLSTSLPGLSDKDPMLRIASSSHEFLESLDEMLEELKAVDVVSDEAIVVEEEYRAILDNLLF